MYIRFLSKTFFVCFHEFLTGIDFQETTGIDNMEYFYFYCGISAEIPGRKLWMFASLIHNFHNAEGDTFICYILYIYWFSEFNLFW